MLLVTDSESFKFKVKITGKTPNDDKILWRTLELLLINCEVNLILTWSTTCVITNSTDAGTFEITDTKLYVPVVTLSTKENAKLLQQEF